MEWGCVKENPPGRGRGEESRLEKSGRGWDTTNSSTESLQGLQLERRTKFEYRKKDTLLQFHTINV